ncbi:MAG: CPBP family intramembrane glutamic endopeptidase [Candidatus Tumulicola sp.]
MNDSTSTISPAWPTRWPKDSFKSVAAWLLAAFMAALFLAVFVAGIRSSALSLRSITPTLIDLSIAVQLVLEGGLVAGLLAALPGLSKFGLRELGFSRPGAATVWTAVAGAVAMAIVANGSASLIDYFGHAKHQQDTVAIFKGLHDPATIAAFAIFAIAFAPIAEETIFRVFFFNFGLRFGGFWGGTLSSAALFGLAHGDLYAALPLALGGVVLAFVYYRTRNAFAPMISHALFNALSIVALLTVPNLASG